MMKNVKRIFLITVLMGVLMLKTVYANVTDWTQLPGHHN